MAVFIISMSLFSCVKATDPTGSEPAQISAAMCKVDITPQKMVYLDGYTYGLESLAKYPEDFLTDIMARILIVEVDGERLLHVNAEMPYISFGISTSISFKSKLASAAGVEEDNVFISDTHDHQSFPKLNSAQEAAIIEGVVRAAEKLAPVKVGVETYGTVFGISRSPDYSRNFDKPYDNTVTIVRFDDAETDEPVGMVYCVSLHNTAFGVSTSDNWHLLNCEFTGFASRYLEGLHADVPDFTAMHLNGFTGNAGPYFPEADRWYSANIGELKSFGEDFGAEIAECYDSVVCRSGVSSGIRVKRTLFKIEKADPMSEKIRTTWGAEPSQILLSAFSVGELAHVGVNAEPFSIIGAHLRAESPYRYLVEASIVDGWCGYIPTSETYLDSREQEIQSWKTPFDSTGEKQFYDAALDVLCALKGVTFERIPAELVSAGEEGSSRLYTFAFDEEISPDKVVLSFDQTSRRNCAEDFLLELIDAAGYTVHTVKIEGNSVNYLGFPVDNVKAAGAVLTVYSTYRSEAAADIAVSLHAMKYAQVENEE